MYKNFKTKVWSLGSHEKI